MPSDQSIQSEKCAISATSKSEDLEDPALIMYQAEYTA